MNDSLKLTEIVPGLFAIGPAAPGQVTYVYYLLQQDSSPPVKPSLQDTWNSNDPALNGWYLFIDTQIDPETAQEFVNSARQNLPTVGTGPGLRQIAWLSSSSTSSPAVFPYGVIAVSLSAFPQAPYKNTLNQPAFQWSALGLEASSSFSILFQQQGVIFNLVDGVFQIWSVIDTNQVMLGYWGQAMGNNNLVAPYPYPFPLDPSSQSWFIQVPLSGLPAGALCFGAGLDPGTLYGNFGCYFQFNSQAGSFAYPMFPPAEPGLRNYLGFDVRFHPLFPRNTERTRLALDLSGTGPGASWSQNSLALRANYFSTPSGSPITLAPCPMPGNESPDLISSPQQFSVPGFAFGKGAASGSPAAWQHYLTPMGHFEIVPGTSPAPPSLPVDIMGGVFAEEYVHAGVGDWVEFVPGMAAFAPSLQSGGSPSPGSPDQQVVLLDALTTSWMKYPCGPAYQGRAYFSQVSSSVYYGHATHFSPGQNFPMAVSALFSHLEDSETFPIVPYGGIYASWNNQSSPNQNVPSQLFAAFEAQILTSARHTRMKPNPSGPIFLPPRADHEMIIAAKALFAAGGEPGMATTHTPQGLLVRLNQGGSPGGPPGTWNTLFLAVSPEQSSPSPGALLSIQGANESGVVDPRLSNVLMKNQLFLVISDPEHLGTFRNEIALGGFNFQLDVGIEKTLLIFKFNTSASLAEFAEQPNLWAATDEFVFDVAAAQAAIRDAISVANQHATAMGHPFAYFSRIAADPGWTGILALNCAINGNGMPLDLQILLGGIKGQLRAHHFGIETNKVQAGSVDPGLDQSSLFGVIYYKNPTEYASPQPNEGDFDYEVETLTVVFNNSVITQFAVQVGLTINKLFGRATNLVGSLTSPPPRNTLVIAGQYQKHGAVGTVTFLSEQPFVYEFPAGEGYTRVIQKVLINQASLVPVSSTPQSPGTLVKANFLMGGQIFFNPVPFPNSDGLDLFSYGTSGKSGTGIAFNGLTANISFVLDAAGEMDPSTKSVTGNLSPLIMSPSSTAIRPNSLMGSLPLQFARFVFSQSGITQSLTGASPIHVLQLEGNQEKGSPAPPPQTSPYGTTTPVYALEYDLPLGSLGSLSDVGVGIMAKLLLAWGPSPVVLDNDGAAVLVQLPSLTAGVAGFTLQGILQTTFGDANLLKVDLDSGEAVYAILFNNIKLSIFGYTFPPGLVVDFTLFAGTQESGGSRNTSNIGWFLAAYQT